MFVPSASNIPWLHVTSCKEALLPSAMMLWATSGSGEGAARSSRPQSWGALPRYVRGQLTCLQLVYQEGICFEMTSKCSLAGSTSVRVPVHTLWYVQLLVVPANVCVPAGDFWDERGDLPVEPLNCVLRELSIWRQAGIPTLMLVGNHDQVGGGTGSMDHHHIS
jgi:hypothetical protein